MIDREHVRVAVDVVFKELRIAVIRTKTGSSIIENRLRYSWNVRQDGCLFQSVTSPKLIQQRRTEGVDEADLKIRIEVPGRAEKAACGTQTCVEGTEHIILPQIIELSKEAIAIAGRVVQP